MGYLSKLCVTMVIVTTEVDKIKELLQYCHNDVFRHVKVVQNKSFDDSSIDNVAFIPKLKV